MKRILAWLKGLFKKQADQKKIVHIQKTTHVLLGNGTRVVTQQNKDHYLKDYALCLRSRMNEYPKWEEVMEAMIEAHSGNFNSLQDVVEKRKSIKNRYPKPKEI
jgi:hypothetical protein